MDDLFGEPERVHISGNVTLEKVCNHILDLVSHNPELINGKTMKQIYNQIIIEVWKDNGLNQVIPQEYIEKLADWMQTDRFIPPDNITRAVRYLSSEVDRIRLPKEAIVDAERKRQNISRSLK